MLLPVSVEQARNWADGIRALVEAEDYQGVRGPEGVPQELDYVELAEDHRTSVYGTRADVLQVGPEVVK